MSASPIPRCARWRGKVSYVIDPDNPYPKNFTGHIRATLKERGNTRSAQSVTCAAARTSRFHRMRHCGEVLRQRAVSAAGRASVRSG